MAVRFSRACRLRRILEPSSPSCIFHLTSNGNTRQEMCPMKTCHLTNEAAACVAAKCRVQRLSSPQTADLLIR